MLQKPKNRELAWWDQLPDQVDKQKVHFKLNPWERFLMNTVAISDFAVRTTGATAMLMASIAHIKKITSDENIESWKYYCNEKFYKKPSLFFKKPKKDVAINIKSASMKGFSDAIVEDLSFASPFEYVNPNYKPIVELGKRPPSAARFIRHGDGPRPVIISVHGFLFDDHELLSSFCGTRGYYDLGYDILLYTLPYHGPRKAKKAKYNGDGFFILDPPTINESVAFSIYDLQIYIGYVKAHSKERLGIAGVSLGAYHAALAVEIDKRIDFAITKIPIVSMWDLILSWQPASILLKRITKKLNFTTSEMRQFMAVHSPLSHKPLIDSENLIMIGAKGDHMVSAHHTNMLWQHWNEPEIIWYPGSHLAHLGRNKYLNAIKEFLKKQMRI